MVADIIRPYLPCEWQYSRYSSDYELAEITSDTTLYQNLKCKVSGNFNLGVTKIVQVENPFLYGQFLLRKEEYVTRGHEEIKELYHDTAANKISSIVSSNLDWRLANRVKYGRGVSFSPSPTYANQESCRLNGSQRAMIVADVLVGKEEMVSFSKELPAGECDTTVGNRAQVYVKYYDDEFYPKYVVYYTSKPHVRTYRRFYW